MNVLHQLLSKAASLCIPIRATIELTKRCNLVCPHCYISGGDYRELNTDEWKSAIDQLEAAGTLYVGLTGGEPFVREDILVLIDYLRRKKFSVSLISNLTLATRRQQEELANVGLSWLYTSIYSADAEVHDKFVGMPGAFQKTVSAAQFMASKGTNVTFLTPLMKPTISEIFRIQNLAQQIGVSFSGSMWIEPKQNGDASPLQYSIDADSLSALLHNDRVLEQKIGLEDLITGCQNLSEGPVCEAGRTSCAFDAYGRIYPCPSWPRAQGELLKETFAGIWEQGADFEMLRKIEMRQLVCATKDCRRYCRPCLALNLLEEGNIETPARSRCAAVGEISKYHRGT